MNGYEYCLMQVEGYFQDNPDVAPPLFERGPGRYFTFRKPQGWAAWDEVAKMFPRASPRTDVLVSNQPEGIARMGHEARDMIELLKLFRQLGRVYQEKQEPAGLSFEKIGDSLHESATNLRNKMKVVSTFFRRYFQQFEKLEVPEDREEMSLEEAEQRKLFERWPGRTFKIYPLGWRAWDLTCRFLD